jgi:uncharacterized alkaline shock family protein YloU
MEGRIGNMLGISALEVNVQVVNVRQKMGIVKTLKPRQMIGMVNSKADEDD